MSVSVRNIDILLVVDGEIRHPSYIDMTLSINSYPRVNVTHHVDKDASEECATVWGKKVANTMKQRQEKMFQERTVPDMELRIKDQFGEISFSGYIVNPNYKFSANQVDLTDIALPEYAKMDSFNPSCYCLDTPQTRVEKDQCPTLKDEKKIPKFFMKLLDFIKKQWELAKKPKSAGGEAQQRIHKVNEKTKKYVQQLMSNSDETFGWEDIKEYLTIGGSINDGLVRGRIISLLRSCSGSFISSLLAFAEDYQCLYIPKWDDVGCLFNRDKIYDNPKELKLTPISMTIEAGSPGLFPSRAVLVCYSPVSFNPRVIDKNDIDETYWTYPTKVEEGGTLVPVPGPPWLPHNANLTKKPNANAGLKADDAKRIAEDAGNGRKEAAEKRLNCIEKWAKSIYLWQSLSGSVIRIQNPLCLYAKVGTRYKIRLPSGVVARGLLWSIQHIISSDGSGRTNATSMLTFTHVEIDGFELPGKN